jgi:hypothetical protein
MKTGAWDLSEADLDAAAGGRYGEYVNPRSMREWIQEGDDYRVWTDYSEYSCRAANAYWGLGGGGPSSQCDWLGYWR